MSNLLKMERYQLSHHFLYWSGVAAVFLIGFFTAETYVPEVMGMERRAAVSLADIFNGMVYDSTFLLILIASVLALILGQEFSCRTIALEVAAGHSRRSIFMAKVVSYLLAFNVMALVYPFAGCMREIARFGFAGGSVLLCQIVKAILYSLALNSATFFIAILICFWLRSAAKAVALTAVTTFVMSLYLGYGMLFKLPVAFLPVFQIREAVMTADFLQPWAILVAGVWIFALWILSWIGFRTCELK